MAKGIVINIGAGGRPGRLVVTDFDPQNRKIVQPGKEIDFKSTLAVNEGDLVDGSIVDDGQGYIYFSVKSILDSNPTIITTNTSGNVTIGTNSAYLVKTGGQINGNVSVNGGVLLVSGGSVSGNISIASDSTIICASGATVSGGTFKITGNGTNAVVVITDSTVNGQFSTQGVTYSYLNGNNMNGKVKSTSDSYVTVTNNIINNDLDIATVVVECKITANTVSGSTTIDPKCQL